LGIGHLTAPKFGQNVFLALRLRSPSGFGFCPKGLFGFSFYGFVFLAMAFRFMSI
jgi:hypothetical protein